MHKTVSMTSSSLSILPCAQFLARKMVSQIWTMKWQNSGKIFFEFPYGVVNWFCRQTENKIWKGKHMTSSITFRSFSSGNHSPSSNFSCILSMKNDFAVSFLGTLLNAIAPPLKRLIDVRRFASIIFIPSATLTKSGFSKEKMIVDLTDEKLLDMRLNCTQTLGEYICW